ncbi:hypothetical protein ACFXO2_44110, partial [Streptomyces sp. NPDC059152]|uniref:hypothetical protein n=1 Tax=Streptomyces sp. NPDC059152 TaxID=3346742 RepID=UPI0036753565
MEIIEFKNRKKKHTRNDISFPFDSEPPPLTIPKGNRQGKIRPLSAPPEIVQQGVTPNKKTTTYKTGLASEKKVSAAPVLVAVIAALLLMRLYPLPLRL